MEESKKKVSFPKEPMALGILISLLVFVIFSLVDMLIYYFGKADPKLSTPMFSFLSIVLLAAVVVLSILKGKTLLSAFFFLLTLIVDNGLFFIRSLFTATISLATFGDFYDFLAFAIMVWLVISIVLQLKKARPSLNLQYPANYLVMFIILGYNLIFNGFNNSLALMLIFSLFVLLDGEHYLGWFIGARFIFGLSNIIDFIVIKSKFDGYKQTFGFWFNNILIIIFFVIGVIAIFKPYLFVLTKKAPECSEKPNEAANKDDSEQPNAEGVE